MENRQSEIDNQINIIDSLEMDYGCPLWIQEEYEAITSGISSTIRLEDMSLNAAAQLEQYLEKHIHNQKKSHYLAQQIDNMLCEMNKQDDSKGILVSLNQQIHSFLPSYRVTYDLLHYRLVNSIGTVIYQTTSIHQIKSFISKYKDFHTTRLTEN